MSNNPFDRIIINPREKPLSTDINRAQSELDYSIRMALRELHNRRAVGGVVGSDSFAATPTTGFLADGLRVTAQLVPNMTVTVKAGMGFMDVPTDLPTAIGGIVGLDDLCSYKPLVLMADSVFTVPAAPGANSRIDIIEARPNRVASDPQTRLVLDPTTGAFNPNTVNKTLQNTLDGSVGSVNDPALSTFALSYKVGVVAAVPVEPVTTPGYVKIARINVGTSVASIGANAIADKRCYLRPGGVGSFAAKWHVQWNGGTPIVTLRRLVAPPGVQIGLVASAAQRALFDVYVVGGNLASVSMVTQIGSDNSAAGVPAAAEAFIHWLDKNGSNDGGAPIDSTAQTTIAGATPSIVTGVGTFYATTRGVSRYFVAGAVNVTNTTLEDIVVSATGEIWWGAPAA